MQTHFRNKPLLLVTIVALALAILGHTSAKAQPGGVPLWTNVYNFGGANAIAVDSSDHVVVTGNGATLAYSSAGVPLWTNPYAPLTFDAYAVTVDGSGNVFVSGSSDIGSAGSPGATIKYSSAGTALWTNLSNFCIGPVTKALAVDGGGNVIVTGYSYATNGYPDYATVKYSGAGVALWTNRYDGPLNGPDQPNAVAVDGSGNAFVTGSSSGRGNPLYMPPSHFATIAYSGAGVPLWTNIYVGPGTGGDSGSAIAVDGRGSVFVTGSSDGGGSGADYATIAYSYAGVPLWTNRYNGPGNDEDVASAIAVDGSGNVVVAGYSYGSGHFNSDYATIKYSGAGVPLWTNRYDAGGDDKAGGVAVDRSGNVFVTGYSIGSGTERDYTTIAYSDEGVPLWTNRYNGSANADDGATAVAVDRNGNVLVTGYSYNDGYVTIKYSAIPPSLTIARTTTNTVALSWPSPSIGFNLQQNTNGIGTVNWSNLVDTPSDNGVAKTVIVEPSIANRFFRLFHP